jgi:RNA polymerase sigma factor (sigma-70 family)
MDTEKNELLCKYLHELKEGNIAVLENIAFIIGKNLMFLANTYLYNKEDAKDAVQTFYYNLVKKSKKFKYNKNAYAWLMTAFSNELKNGLAKKKRERKAIEQMKLDLAQNRINNDDFLENNLFISEIFSKLNNYEKALVEMKLIQGLPFNYIAKVLHKPESTIRNHFDKVKEKIKNL